MNTIDTHNSLQNMKKHNRSRVLALLHDEPLISRVEIAKRTKLTKQTVTNIVNELLEKDIVVEKRSEHSGAVGRKPVLLDLNRERILAGGIEMTRTSIRSVLMNNAGDILYDEERSIDGTERGERAVRELELVSQEMLAAVPEGSLLTGIGVGIQGVVNKETGTVQYSKSVNLYEYPLRDHMQRELGIPVIVDHRVRAFATGEIWRRKKDGLRNVLCIYMNEGVGGALIVNGKLYQGAADQAGKIGHMKVVPNGKTCYCGQHGCLVAYIATQHLMEQAELAASDSHISGSSGDSRIIGPSGNSSHAGGSGTSDSFSYSGHSRFSRFSEFVRYLDSGHGHDIMREAGRYLGFALGNAVNLLNPEAIIMGGELVKARDWFLDDMKEQMTNTASIPGVHTPVLISEYQDNNCSTGAAAMAFYAWVEG